MGYYRILVNESGVGVKDGGYFDSRGGLTEEWGRNWERVEADSLYEARNKGIKLRRERFPSANMTMGEDGEPPERYWPEARGF